MRAARRFTVGNSFDHDDQGVTLDSRNPAARPWHVRDNHDRQLVGRFADPADARALAEALNDVEAEVADGTQDADELRRLAAIEAHDAWEADIDDPDTLERRLEAS